MISNINIHHQYERQMHLIVNRASKYRYLLYAEQKQYMSSLENQKNNKNLFSKKIKSVISLTFEKILNIWRKEWFVPKLRLNSVHIF